MIALAVALAASAPQATTLFTIDPRHRLVEGIATDGKTVWVSSVLDRTILECRRRCRAIAVLPKGLHPLGLAWDATAKRLWVAADCPKLPGVTACAQGALLGLDRSGRIRARPAGATAGFHPGDVSAGGGQVYVSDSGTGKIYWLAPDGDLADEFPTLAGKSAQGSALSADGKQLIAADYSQGISSIDLATGQRTLLPRQDGRPLRGIDGLVRCGPGFVGVYNGTSPGALVTIALREGGITYGELVEGLKLLDPTQIAFDGRRLLVIANAGWEAAAKPPAPRTQGTPIVAIAVDRNCRPK